MRRMFEVDITKSVPRFILMDKNGYALAKAIEAALQYMNDTIEKGVKCISDYDEMPEWRLDELAWELNVEWYDYTYPVSMKRRIIRQCAQDKKINGTKAAVLSVLRSIYDDVTLQEWFEYGGEPYHFRLEMEMTEALTEEQHLRALENIEFYKNVRSELEDVNYNYGSSGEYRIGAGTASSVRVEIQPEA